MPYPGQMPSLPDLVQTFGPMFPGTYDMARQQVGIQQQYNQEVNQGQQLENDRYQQLTPGVVQAQDLQNQGTQLTNQGLQTKNDEAARDLQVRQGVPLQTEIDSRTQGILSKMSDDQLTTLTNGLQQKALSTDPIQRRQALSLLQNVAAYRMEQLRQSAETQRAYGVASIQGKNELNLDRQQAQEGKYFKLANSSDAVRINNIKDPIQKDSALRMAVAKARQNGDTESEQYFTELWRANKPTADAALNAKTAGNQGRPDLNKLGVGGIQPTQLPGIDDDRPTQQPPQVAALLQKLPQGSKYNGDGTFTLPDGRIVKPKGQ